MAWKIFFLILSLSCAAAGVTAVASSSSWLGYLEAFILLISSGMLYHVWSLQPAANMSLGGILDSYMEKGILAQLLGTILMLRFKSRCQDVEETQRKTLEHYLKVGKTTIYGRDHNMAEMTMKNFRSRMLLTTYEDYKGYINRCLDGEENIFFKEQVDFFGATSGTTSGKSKLFPLNISKNNMHVFSSLLPTLYFLRKHIPGLKMLTRAQTMAIPSKIHKTERGFDKGSVSSKMMPHKRYECTPKELAGIYDEYSAHYVQLVFTLRDKELGFLYIMTSALVLKIFSMVEHDWEKLVADIRQGELDSTLDIPKNIRLALNRQMKPLPDRADELSAIFQSGFKHVVPRIWPSLTGISAITTGDFAVQSKAVQELYIGPDIPVVTLGHISTEGICGVILYDQGLRYEDTGRIRDDYVILPHINYYEFIHAGNIDEDQPQTLLAHQVAVGEEYELVITNCRGLYRYRTGDVVRVVGYLGNTPRYQIQYRVGDILNLHVEKLPERVFREAFIEAANGWTSGKLVNYAVTENVHVDQITGDISDKLFYVVFLETDSEQHLSPTEKALLDEHLRNLSDTYRAFRARGTISPPRLVHVSHKAFDLVKDFTAERNPMLSRMQYKHPRILRNKAKLEILLNNQI